MKHFSNNIRKAIVIIIALFGAGNVHSQQAITQASYTATVVKTIVREYSYPATVSYVETAAEHYFAYADASMTVRNAEIDPDLFVTDMKVHNEYAYFCGYNTSLSKSVWGWFDINTLIAGNLAYYTHYDFECNGLQADTLYSLCIFEEQGSLHIATVGTATDGQGKRRPCTIDITGNEGSQAGWSYSMGVSDCPHITHIRYTNICVTDNYVVAAGDMELSFCSEGYRFHKRSNLFLSGGPYDSLYTFPAYGQWSNHYGHKIAMTHTTGDNIASAVYWYAYIDYIHPAGVLVNVYDINQVLTIPSASPVYSMRASLPQKIGNDIYKYNIRDIIYSNIHKELVLLLSGDFPYGLGTCSILAELTLPPTTFFNYLKIQDNIFTSLDNYHSQQNLLTQGYDNIYPGTSSYFTQPLATPSLCADQSFYSSTVTTYAAKTHYCPYTVCSNKFDCTYVKQINTLDIPNETLCSN